MADNYSNAVLTTEQIQDNLSILEASNLASWWLSNCTSGLSATDQDYLTRNFPRSNLLRQLMLELAFTMPLPSIVPSDSVEDEAKREAIEAKVKALMERRTWEGNKDFWAALDWWRVFTFTTGDTFVKLAQNPDNPKEVWPERMPSQNSFLKPDPQRRKVVSEYQFTYKAGGAASTDGTGALTVQENISSSQWVVLENGKETKNDKLPWGWAPVAHLAWEEREDGPRGLPLMDRLKEKVLHLLCVAVGRREGVKKSGQGVWVLKNAEGTVPALNSGALVRLSDASPTQKADLTVAANDFSDGPARQEYLDALRECYTEAFLGYTLDENGNASAPQSGRAMQQMSKRELKYRSAFTKAEGAFLEELFLKALTIEGLAVQPGELLCRYDLADEPMPEERRKNAQLYFDQGMMELGLKAMGHDEEEIKAILESREERQTLDLLNPGRMPGKAVAMKPEAEAEDEGEEDEEGMADEAEDQREAMGTDTEEGMGG